MHQPRTHAHTPERRCPQVLGCGLQGSAVCDRDVTEITAVHHAISRSDVVEQKIALGLNGLASQRCGNSGATAIHSQPGDERARRSGCELLLMADCTADLTKQVTAVLHCCRIWWIRVLRRHLRGPHEF